MYVQRALLIGSGLSVATECRTREPYAKQLPKPCYTSLTKLQISKHPTIPAVWPGSAPAEETRDQAMPPAVANTWAPMARTDGYTDRVHRTDARFLDQTAPETAPGTVARIAQRPRGYRHAQVFVWKRPG